MTMRLRALFVALAISTAAAPALAGPCLAAISSAIAKKVFDGLAAAKPSDGCILENVETDRATMKIIWKKGEGLVDPIIVVPASCAPGSTGGGLAATVPSAVENACPEAAKLTISVVASNDVGEPVKVTAPIALPTIATPREPPPLLRYSRYLYFGVAGLALVGAAIAAFVLRKKTRSS